jgi:hypothetical protein
MKTEIGILPDRIVKRVKAEGKGYRFGRVRLDIIFRDGKPRWEIGRTESIIEDDQKGVAK